MKNIRIIPRLDIKGPNLVKGIHLEGLRVLGKPWYFANKYYHEGADELIYIDAVASLYGRNSLTEIVKQTAENLFIPLTVGGGVRSIENINELLRAGADKVAINTYAVENPFIIRDGAREFGSQCIVGSIQAKLINGKHMVFTDNGRESTSIEVYDWAKQLVDLGAGEIILTSIDQEGTGKGYDIALIQRLSEELPVPVIACGGCGTIKHIEEVISIGKADAIAASSIFHYNYLSEMLSEEQYEEEGNIEFLKKVKEGSGFMKNTLEPAGIPQVKRRLADQQISCRIDE